MMPQGASSPSGLRQTSTNLWSAIDLAAQMHQPKLSKNSGKYGKLPRGSVKVGFWAVLKPLVGWDGLKVGLEWSRTLPKASPDTLECKSF